eukprot:11173968-Lingulodinium_polyedra.AAC.1
MSRGADGRVAHLARAILGVAKKEAGGVLHGGPPSPWFHRRQVLFSHQGLPHLTLEYPADSWGIGRPVDGPA